MYRLPRLPQLLLQTLRSFRWRQLVWLFAAILRLALQPRSYRSWQESERSVAPMLFILLSMVVSVIRFRVDPNIGYTMKLLHCESVPHGIGVVCTVIGSGLGAILIPQFWYWILKLRVQRDAFVGAMMIMYAVVVIPWDISSLLWMPSVLNGSIAFWLPDLVKTALITLYCSLIGSQLAHLLEPEDDAPLPALSEDEAVG